MGLFLNNHVNHKDYIQRNAQYGAYLNGSYSNYGYGNCYNNYDFGTMLVSMLPSLFSLGAEALTKDDDTSSHKPGSGASAAGGSASPRSSAASPSNSPSNSPANAPDTSGSNADTDQKIRELEAKRDSIFNTIDGADELADLSDLISQEQSALTDLETSISGNNSPEKIQELINNCYSDTNNTTLIDGITEANVTALKNRLDNAKDIRDNKIPEQKLKIGELEAKRIQIENINEQIEVLNNRKQNNQDGYSVTQETNDINEFMTALKNFQANNNKTTAQALKDAYDNDSKNGHTSVEKAWKLIEPKVNAVLNNQ